MRTYYIIIDSRQPFGAGLGNRAYTERAYAEQVLRRVLRRYVPGWEDIASAYYSVVPIHVAHE